MNQLEIRIQDTVPGRLPRIPKSEWESKRRKPEKVTFKPQRYDWKTKKMVPEKPITVTMKGGLYLEDILVWCKCKEPVNGDYIVEEDGTHGVVCSRCGGVIQLG